MAVSYFKGKQQTKQESDLCEDFHAKALPQDFGQIEDRLMDTAPYLSGHKTIIADLIIQFL